MALDCTDLESFRLCAAAVLYLDAARFMGYDTDVSLAYLVRPDWLGKVALRRWLTRIPTTWSEDISMKAHPIQNDLQSGLMPHHDV